MPENNAMENDVVENIGRPLLRRLDDYLSEIRHCHLRIGDLESEVTDLRSGLGTVSATLQTLEVLVGRLVESGTDDEFVQKVRVAAAGALSTANARMAQLKIRHGLTVVPDLVDRMGS